MSEQVKPFRQVGPIEYEIQIAGKTKSIRVPFALTESIFKSFIESGGVIDPETGQVQQDIRALIGSFKEIGNLLLSEFDEEGHELKKGNCGNLGASDVIVLFQLAAFIVEDFIKALTQMQAPQSQPEAPKEEKSPKTKD